MHLRRWPAALLLAPLAGLLQALSVAVPWDGQPRWWLQLLSLAVLAALLQRGPAPRRAALLGWLFATAWLAGTFWWLFISMHFYGGLPAPMAAAGVLLLAGFLALYYALACALHAALGRPGGGSNALLFGSLWLGAELLRGSLFTGFPWGAGGYAHVDGPLAWLAPWVGVYGIGFAAAALAHVAGTALAVRQPRRHWLVIAVLVVLLAGADAARRDAPAPRQRPALSVALLQGNIPQDEKFESRTGVPVALRWYRDQLAAARTSLVVAPETAIPLLPRQLPEGYMAGIEHRFASGAQAALVGLPLGGLEEGYTNSVLGWRPGAPPYRYDKHHLVPFGEFIPDFFKWFTRMMNIPLGDFDRGDVGQASFDWQGERLAPNICYEDLFGEELAARFRDPARAPTVFVNVSNIAWFGNSVAIDQHLHISRMRALEFERPVIRATNTGATAIIDRAGYVTHILPRHTRGVLTGEVEGATGLTPYARWVSRLWLWPLWGVVLAACVAGWARRRTRP